jgi:Bacteriophage lambda head decoration protein D
MPVLHEPVHLSDLLKYEAPNLYSRDEVIVAAGQSLVLGAVVGRITATHEIVAIDPTASDGRETVAGVLIEAVVTAAAERKRSVIVSRHAIVLRADHGRTRAADRARHRRPPASAGHRPC